MPSPTPPRIGACACTPTIARRPSVKHSLAGWRPTRGMPKNIRRCWKSGKQPTCCRAAPPSSTSTHLPNTPPAPATGGRWRLLRPSPWQCCRWPAGWGGNRAGCPTTTSTSKPVTACRPWSSATAARYSSTCTPSSPSSTTRTSARSRSSAARRSSRCDTTAATRSSCVQAVARPGSPAPSSTCGSTRTR
ncbi:hypothetical protein D3C80_1355860 [compost metagenome]